MSITIELKNYRKHRHVLWTLERGEVHLLVGPNGSGKSGLLGGLRAIQRMVTEGTQRALSADGENLLNWHAKPGAIIAMGLGVGQQSWNIKLLAASPTVQPHAAEQMRFADVVLASKNSGESEIHFSDPRKAHLGQPFALMLPFLAEMALVSNEAHHEDSVMFLTDETSKALLRQIKEFRSYPEGNAVGYDLQRLRTSGSDSNSDIIMSPDGTNVFTVLRNWRDRIATRDQFHRVMEGLKQAFPEVLVDLEFETAGRLVVGQFVPPGNAKRRIPPQDAPNGVLSWLLSAVAVAGATPGCIVAIDEPETALHPDAQRRLLDFMRNEAAENNLCVILATHSGVLLDAMNKSREYIWTLTGDDEQQQPRPIDEVADPKWAALFSAGALYQRNDVAGQAKPDSRGAVEDAE